MSLDMAEFSPANVTRGEMENLAESIQNFRNFIVEGADLYRLQPKSEREKFKEAIKRVDELIHKLEKGSYKVFDPEYLDD